MLNSCSPELLKLASEYEGNLLNINKLQKQFRKELSDCEYDKDCFDERIKQYIETEICIEPVYKEYGFISIGECEKACFILADQVIKLSNFGGVACKEELAKVYDLEDEKHNAEQELIEAETEYKKHDNTEEESEYWEEYQEERENYDEARNEYNKAIGEYNRCIAGIN